MKECILLLFKKEGFIPDDLSVILCSDEYLLEMNRTYLNHDTYTDIITFDLSNRKELAASGKNLPIRGELYISTDRIQENANDFGVDRETELRRVIFHGCLHLCGYGDKKKEEKEKMRTKEDQYLRLYNKSKPD